MDWSWSAVADDVSALTDRLTVWELRLFYAGAHAVQDWEYWQHKGRRRTAIRRVVTPTAGEIEKSNSAAGQDDEANVDISPLKRQRLE